MKAVTKSLLALVIAFGLLAVGSAVLLAVDDGAQAEPPATVTVAHFAPFGATITDTSVSVYVNGTEAISKFVFAQKVSGIKLPAGVYTISIAPTGGSPVLTTPVTVTAGTDYFIAAIGGANGWPLELYPLVNNNTPLTDTGKVRISHLAPFAAGANATKVDICSRSDDKPITGLTDIPYKATTPYLPLKPGIYDLYISPAGTNCATKALVIPPFGIAKGQVADVFAIGLLSPPATPALGLQVSEIGLTSRARIAHFAPFASQIVSTSVTVRVAGQDLITGFVFPQVTPYLNLAPGSYPVEIIPTGSVTPAITGTAEISGFLDYTFAAIGDVVNQPLQLVRTIDDNFSTPPAGKARVRIDHFAPFANTIAGTKVDICAAKNSTPLVKDLVYKEHATVDLPTGIYRTVFIAAPSTSCASAIVTLPPFFVLPDQIAYAFAVGDVVNIAPTVVTQPNLLVEAWLYFAEIFRDGTPK